jgi:hypothetical protein
MNAATLKMLIDYYVGDMRLKSRTPDSIRINASTLAAFARRAERCQIGGAQSKGALWWRKQALSRHGRIL